MRFATLGTLALTLTSLITTDAQAFGRRKRGNADCCPPPPCCPTYGGGMWSGHAMYGSGHWTTGYAMGGCGCASSYGYAMAPTMSYGTTAYGYAGDPNATQGYTGGAGQTSGFAGNQTQPGQPLPMPGTSGTTGTTGSGSIAGQSTNPQSNPNSSGGTNSNTTPGTNSGSGVVQASGTNPVNPSQQGQMQGQTFQQGQSFQQGAMFPQGGVQQMAYPAAGVTYATPTYYGGVSAIDYCYTYSDTGMSRRRGLFRR